MKKYLYISVPVSILFALSGVVYAQQGQGTGEQVGVQDPATHDGTGLYPAGNQVQNQNQVNTQNQGEDYQLKTNTNTSTKSGFGKQDPSQVPVSFSGSGARQKIDDVDKFFGSISAGSMFGKISSQVDEIIKEQQTAQLDISEAVNKIDSREGLLRKILGYNHSAVSKVEKLMEQNQVRIAQLQQLRIQTQNQSEQSMLQEMVRVMMEQNTALQDGVNMEKQDPGMFGWLFRLFR